MKTTKTPGWAATQPNCTSRQIFWRSWAPTPVWTMLICGKFPYSPTDPTEVKIQTIASYIYPIPLPPHIHAACGNVASIHLDRPPHRAHWPLAPNQTTLSVWPFRLCKSESSAMVSNKHRKLSQFATLESSHKLPVNIFCSSISVLSSRNQSAPSCMQQFHHKP